MLWLLRQLSKYIIRMYVYNRFSLLKITIIIRRALYYMIKRLSGHHEQIYNISDSSND
jgi:hypothetical protein